MSDVNKIVLVPPSIHLKHYWKEKNNADSQSTPTTTPTSTQVNVPEKKRASLTQQLVRTLSWNWGKKESETHKALDKFDHLHQWTPDKLLKNHYRDGFNALWVQYLPEEDDEDEDNNLYDLDHKSRKLIHDLYASRKNNQEVYLKKNTQPLFFMKVIKKEIAFNDQYEISHAIWNIDRILDENEWEFISNLASESLEYITKIGYTKRIKELLEIVELDIQYRNQYNLEANTTEKIVPKSNSPSLLKNQELNSTSPSNSSGSTGYSIINIFSNYLKNYCFNFSKTLTSRIEALRKSLIITNEIDLEFMKARVNALHQKLLQNILEELDLCYSNSSIFHEYEILNEEDESKCLEYISFATRSLVEYELNKKIFSGKWELKYKDGDKGFYNICNKCKDFSLEQLGLDSQNRSQFECALEEPIALFKELDTLDVSYQKLVQLKLCVDSIMRSIEQHQINLSKSKKDVEMEPITSDQLIPLLEWVIIHSFPEKMERNLQYIDIMKPEEFEMSDMGYAFVSFYAAVEYIKEISKQITVQNVTEMKEQVKKILPIKKKITLPSTRRPITIDPHLSEKRKNTSIGGFLEDLLSDSD